MSNLLDVSQFTAQEFKYLAEVGEEERFKILDSKLKKDFTQEDLTNVTPMKWYEEWAAILLFLFGVPGAVFSFPVLAVILGYLFNAYKIVFTIFIAAGVTLSILPAPFIESSLSSWPALQILRYFSFKGIFEERLTKDKPYILVAPPHGVFPFGNIATMIAFPSIEGFSFRALVASAALRAPCFRQLLCTIGGIDASRETATKALKKNYTLGISTGGVAEVFDVDLRPNGNEVIELKERKGIIKLAFRTGAALVPCYLLGNTHLLSCYCGGSPRSSFHQFLKSISRKLGFACILFWGRFGLPIPYRIPIVGIMAKPIEVPMKEDPTEEEINEMHGRLEDEMRKLFDKHKEKYGWGNKKLVIH
jgi:hypothetical protein